jgi:hypothetical protein
MAKKPRKIPPEEAAILMRKCWDHNYLEDPDLEGIECNDFDYFWGRMAGSGFSLAQKKPPSNTLAIQLHLIGVDEGGGLHSVSRRVGVPITEIRKRFKDLDPCRLPTVEYVLAINKQQQQEALKAEKK